MANNIAPQHQRLAVWQWDDSGNSYIDNSKNARSIKTSPFNVFETISNYLYIGLENRFDMAIFFISRGGSISDIEWEYWDGDSWNEFIPGIEFEFSTTGAEGFYRLNDWRRALFTNNFPHLNANGLPDEILRYWVRCKAGTVTTPPSIDRIAIRAYAEYATVNDVNNILQIKTKFSDTTLPTYNTVEDYIHRAQSEVDYRTRKTWRPNVQIDEEHDFNRNGIHLVKNYPIEILDLSIWDGRAYEVKKQGRNEEFFLVPDQGMIYFARFFLLPARIQAYGAALWGWGFGEFSHPVKISYIYGSNIFDNEREGGLVNDVTKKMAAIDVLQNYDYTTMLPSGVDKMSLERKSDLWRAEIDNSIELLCSWESF